MIDYLYDGSFEGLLTCIYHHYYTEKASGVFQKSEYQSNMMNRYLEVETCSEKADRVYKAIGEKISKYDLGRIYKAYLSSVPDKEMKILRYVVLGFRYGCKISNYHGAKTVFDIQEAEKKINVEMDKLYGLVRFSQLENGVMYSEVEPDHDVLELVANHFSDRFRGQPFIINDLRRDKALVAYGGKWEITSFAALELPPFEKEETKYRKMWKSYFDTMAIKERINPKCQANMMPRKYWKYLTEMQPDID